jgi:hypothetical protein
MKKKYIKAYKASALVFVLAIPTIIGPFIGLGMAVGTTAHLLAHLIRNPGIRAAYYALTLGASAAFVAGCIVALINEDPLEAVLSIAVLLIIAGFLFLGIAAAFAARLFIWAQERAYYRRVKAGKSGVNTY